MRVGPARAALVLALVACRSHRAADSAFARADSLRALGQADVAAPLYRQLRDSLAARHDTAGVWKATLWLGWCMMRLGQRDSAHALFTQSLALALARGDPGQEGWSRTLYSNSLDLQGRFDSALVQATRARALAERSRDPSLGDAADNALGRIYAQTGRHRAALALHAATLARRRRTPGGPPARLAFDLNEICIDYWRLGRYSEAKAACSEGLGIYRRLGDVDGSARTSLNLANVDADGGAPDSARTLYVQALHGYEQHHNVRGMAFASGDLAELYRDAGNYTLARGYIERQAEIARPAGLAASLVLALENLGLLELDLKHAGLAQRAFAQGLRLADSLGYDIQRAEIRIGRSGAALALGDRAAALAWAEQAARLADSLGSPDLQLRAREAKAAALRAAGRRAAALGEYLQAIDSLESWRGRLALGDLRMGVVASHLGSFEHAIDLLLAMGRSADALAIAERARARLLLELMTDRAVHATAATPRDRLIADLRAAYAERADAEPGARAQLDAELKERAESLTTLEAAEQAGERAQRARYPAPASIAALRAGLLQPDRGLLVFFWGDSAVYGWWLSGRTLHGARLGAADSLAALVEFLRSAIERPAGGADWRPAARWAYARLVAPLRPEMVREWCLVPDGPLAYLPFEVLLPDDAAPPLGATLRLVYGPSSSVLLALAQPGTPAPWRRAVLAVGNPQQRRATAPTDGARGTGWAPLPYAETEARQVEELFRADGADLLIGTRATRARWLGLAPGRYRYLHFAAHASVADQASGPTALELADGPLDLAAIRALDLHAELVTLSACETALGVTVRGEGIVGLSHAFLAAGARGALVSLWRVDDRATADFMGDFYRALRAGRAPAEALLEVRRARWAGGGPAAHPSAWAPFILVGAIAP